ncbi:hypothetical protein KI387_008485, partial [Taxus chinensis]
MAEWMEEGGVKLYDMMVAATKPMALKFAVLLRIPDIIATYGYVSDDGETSKSLSVKEIASHISLLYNLKGSILCLNCAGVEHVGGSMFEAIPAADAVFLKCILHDWDDEKSVVLLRKCHEAIPIN